MTQSLVSVPDLKCSPCQDLWHFYAVVVLTFQHDTLLQSQIIASASAVYDIPWPPAFLSLISTLRIFLVDVVSLTKANCAQPMTFYASLVVILLGLKLALALLLVGPWLWGQLHRGSTSLSRWLRRRALYRHTAVLETTMQRAGHRRASIIHAIQGSIKGAQSQLSTIDWIKVFKASFMLLFVAYPGMC